MTQITIHSPAGIVACICGWIRRHQDDLSDRVHAADEERARRHGWEVTKNTGLLGIGTRSYRDPRFNSRRWRDSRAATQLTGPKAGGYQIQASNDERACGVGE
jgi:hypothetical protein